MNDDSTNRRQTHKLIISLRSGTCPACCGVKKSRQTFCRKCYFKLPPDMREALYDLVGEGYEEAFFAACDHLGVDRPGLTSEDDA